jgi:hypothetical protein
LDVVGRHRRTIGTANTDDVCPIVLDHEQRAECPAASGLEQRLAQVLSKAIGFLGAGKAVGSLAMRCNTRSKLAIQLVAPVLERSAIQSRTSRTSLSARRVSATFMPRP